MSWQDQDRTADEIPWRSVPSPIFKHEKDMRHILSSSQALHFDTSIAKYLKDSTVIAVQSVDRKIPIPKWIRREQISTSSRSPIL